MKDYTVDNPTYSGNIKLLETTDTDHAENFNVPYKQFLGFSAGLDVGIFKCVDGCGLSLFVDVEGILNVTLVDGREDGVEETGNEADNQSS